MRIPSLLAADLPRLLNLALLPQNGSAFIVHPTYSSRTRRVKKRQQKTMFQDAGRQALIPIPEGENAITKPAPGTSNFQGLFSPGNLQEQAGASG